MIGLKDAVDSALIHIRELYRDMGARDFLLEEVELTSGGIFWDVTVGFNVTESDPPSPLEQIRARTGSIVLDTERTRLARKYKTLRIAAETGQVSSVRMRDL